MEIVSFRTWGRAVTFQLPEVYYFGHSTQMNIQWVSIIKKKLYSQVIWLWYNRIKLFR